MRIHSSAIRYFDAVRRAGSIREAARVLNVASSAVNRQILKLEAEVGTPLFERHANGVTLTSAGEMMARHVIVVLQDLERARSDIEALKGLQVGHVSVAAVEGVSATLLGHAIRAMNQRAPRISISARTLGSQQIFDALADGETDIGIAFAGPHDARIRTVHAIRYRLGTILSPDHPLAGAAALTLADCAAYPLILPSPRLSLHEQLADPLRKLGREPQVALTTDSIDLTRQLVEQPPMIAFQSEFGLGALIARRRLAFVPLTTPAGPIWTRLGVYVRAERLLPGAVDLFIDTLLRQLPATDSQADPVP